MMFGTTPTTVRHSPGWFRFDRAERLPSGCSPGQNVAAKLWFTIATGNAAASIAVVEVAAGDRGGSDHPEVVRSDGQELDGLVAVRRAGPALDLERRERSPFTGMLLATDASSIPGMVFNCASSRSKYARRVAGARVLVGRQSHDPTRMCSGSRTPVSAPTIVHEAPHQDACPREQHDGQRHLAGHQPRRQVFAAQALVTPRASPFSAPLTPSCTTLTIGASEHRSPATTEIATR